eukprot:1315867-Prymnesium_polylepis.1
MDITSSAPKSSVSSVWPSSDVTRIFSRMQFSFPSVMTVTSSSASWGARSCSARTIPVLPPGFGRRTRPSALEFFTNAAIVLRSSFVWPFIDAERSTTIPISRSTSTGLRADERKSVCKGLSGSLKPQMPRTCGATTAVWRADITACVMMN